MEERTRLSGSTCDGEFATGFLSALPSTVREQFEGHLRPRATLGMPLGTVLGDLGFVIASESSRTLVIVECERSAPGNERNILKWAEVGRVGRPISLVSTGVSTFPQYDRVLLLADFARTEKWAASDYSKTIAFCRLIADIINTASFGYEKPMHVLVADCQEPVADWNQCGRTAGERFSRLMSDLNWTASK